MQNYTLGLFILFFFVSREKTVLLTLFIVNVENLTIQNYFDQSSE